MQEQVNEKSISLVIRGTKLTARLLQKAMAKVLQDMKQQQNKKQHSKQNTKTYQGKQSMKQLVQQGAGVSNIEIHDPSIRSFDRVARKYGVDYAVKVDKSCDPPKWLVFFKAKDSDALTAAFNEFAAQKVKTADKPSLLATLSRMKDIVKNQVIDTVKNKDKGLER